MTDARPHHSVAMDDLAQAAARYRLDAQDLGTPVKSRWLVALGRHTTHAAAIVAIDRATCLSELKLF
jgi:hypothetical protein